MNSITNERKKSTKYNLGAKRIPVDKLTDVQLRKGYYHTEVRKGKIAREILELELRYSKEVNVLAAISEEIQKRNLETITEETVVICDPPSSTSI